MRLNPRLPILVLTGAGISAESGVRTFRDAGGLWEGHRVEEVATPEGFARDPELVQRFYDARRRQLREVEPNAAHLALARLEQAWPGGLLLVTQNVDDLHERAGSRALIHLHGELRKARCLRCGAVHAWDEDLLGAACPACGGGLRPHIVWFGELPFELDRIFEELGRSGLFLSVGTSGNVYPAAGFVQNVGRGCVTAELNLEPSLNAYAFDVRRYGPATEILPAFVEELLASL